MLVNVKRSDSANCSVLVKFSETVRLAGSETVGTGGTNSASGRIGGCRSRCWKRSELPRRSVSVKKSVTFVLPNGSVFVVVVE